MSKSICPTCPKRHSCNLADPDSIQCNEGTCAICDAATGAHPSLAEHGRAVRETMRQIYMVEIERLRQERDEFREASEERAEAAEAAEAEVRDLRAKVAALTSALERTEANFRLAVNGKPVRDMAENLAENAEALASVGRTEPEGAGAREVSVCSHGNPATDRDHLCALPDPEHCQPSKRADGKHSWRFDGDDPYVVCHFCDEMREAQTGRVIRPAAPAPEAGGEP